MSLTPSIDPHLAGVLIANMLEAWLTAGAEPEPTEEAVDEHRDHPATSEQAGVHLYSSVDLGPGAPPSGEHRAAICAAREGAGTGVATHGGPDPGPRPRSVGGADGGPGGLQDAGGRCLDGASGCSVCTGSVATGALEPGLASVARTVCAHSYPGDRRRWLLRSVMLMPSFVCSRGDNQMVSHAR